MEMVMSMRNFKKYRQQNKEKQTDVANWLGIERSTYSKYEAGATEPPFSTLVRLAEHWNTSVYELMGYSGIKSSTDNVSGAKQEILEIVDRLSDEQIRKLIQLANVALDL